MSKPYVVIATPVFKQTLTKLRSFIARKHNEELAQTALDSIKQRCMELTTNPMLAPVSERLNSVGLSQYRQLLVDKHNLVFYRVDENARKVILLVAMDARQDIERLLFETLISFD